MSQAGENGGGADGPRQVDGEGRPYLTLAQFLKREKLADSGGAAKHLARSGAVSVNGEPEARPGRKLREGDQVRIEGRELVVRLAPPAV